MVFYRRLAEIARDYLRKGSSIYVEGRLRTRKWQDKERKDRYTTDIEATELMMLGSKPAGTGVDPASSARPGAAAGAAGLPPADEEYDYLF